MNEVRMSIASRIDRVNYLYNQTRDKKERSLLLDESEVLFMALLALNKIQDRRI